jgi:hypothetical protein
MELHTIMNRLGDTRSAEQAGIKTASAPSNGTTAPSSEALRSALHSALSTEKTAAAAAPASAPQATPEGDLLKMAEDLSNAEEQAMQKQASILGAAMCDGFMERFAQYEGAAAQVAPQPAKTAAVHAVADPSIEMIKSAAQDPGFQKFAAENPDLVKEAFDLGYQQTYGQLVKQAQDEFQRGYDETMTQVHEKAAEVYKTAAISINNVIREARAA